MGTQIFSAVTPTPPASRSSLHDVVLQSTYNVTDLGSGDGTLYAAAIWRGTMQEDVPSVVHLTSSTFLDMGWILLDEQTAAGTNGISLTAEFLKKRDVPVICVSGAFLVFLIAHCPVSNTGRRNQCNTYLVYLSAGPSREHADSSSHLYFTDFHPLPDFSSCCLPFSRLHQQTRRDLLLFIGTDSLLCLEAINSARRPLLRSHS
jgi:hypothetical protein